MKSNYLRLQHYATLQETIAANYCRRKKSRDHLVTILDIQTYQIIIADHIVKNVRKWDTVVKNAETRYADRHLLPKPSRQGNINTVAKYCNYCKKTHAKQDIRNECRTLNRRSGTASEGSMKTHDGKDRI